MRPVHKSRTWIVYVLYGLSGFVSLGYQVSWFRIFVDQFGSSNLTFVLVICNFLGGLGAGALLSKTLSKQLAGVLKLDGPLRVYGVVEILVAVTSLLTLLQGLLPADLWGSFPYLLDAGVYRPTLAYQLSKTAIAVSVIFVPCFFMGVTFPQLCHIFARSARFPAALYGWNTLGACSAILACEFWFLPWLGHDRTFLLMSGINLLIGLFFLIRGHTVHAPATPSRVERRGAKKYKQHRTPKPPVHPTVLLVCALLSGLLCGAVEGDMFKRLQFLGCVYGSSMAFVSFWAVLAIFLASWTVRAVPKLGLGTIKIAYVAAFVCYSALWLNAQELKVHFTAPEVEIVRQAVAARAVTGSSALHYPFEYGPKALFAYTGAFVFPTYFLLSLLLPFVCNRVQLSRKHISRVYGINTAAFCLGMVGFAWIAPRVNIFYSTKLLMALFAISVGLLVVVRATQSPTPWKPGVAAAAFVVACLLVPASFDTGYFRKDHPAAVYPVRALRSNGAHTSYIVESPSGDRLFFNDFPMSSARGPAEEYMRLMAHFPLLAHPKPRSALLICFGVGNTASAIAYHDSIKRLDIVDLNDQVYATAPEFAATNNKVYEDPRVTLIHDDGRNFLKMTNQKYDLITSEPPPPMHEGVYRLYTAEYYESVLEHLTHDGMMTQWLPLWQMPTEAVELAVSTFVGAFPHNLLFIGYSDDFILVGGKTEIDVRRIEQRFSQSPRVAADLARIRCPTATAVLARIVAGDRSLRRAFEGRGVLNDQHNDFAHIARDPFNPPGFDYDPLTLLAEIRAERLEHYEALRRFLLSQAWKERVRARTTLRLAPR